MPSDVRTVLVPATVHGRVLVRDAPVPAGILVGFHGYMESAAIQMERLDALDLGDWTLVSVQGLSRFYRGRSEDVVAGWMTRQDREAAIEDNIGYVDRVTGVIGANHLPLVTAGFSQGVAMAFRAGLRGARRASAVIAVGGDVPPELLAEPSVKFPRVLLIRGERDDWYTAGKLDADINALESRGVAVESFVHEGGHEWTAAVSRRAAEFVHNGSGRRPEVG